MNFLYVGVKGVGEQTQRVHLEMEPGDTVFFHPILLHGSGQNRSSGFRRAISAHYASATCRYRAGPVPHQQGSAVRAGARPASTRAASEPPRGEPVKALPRLSLPGGVDGDGHVLEPPDLWERYLEAPLRSRALRMRKDEQGLEYLEIDGRPSKLVRGGMPAGLGAMDRVGGIVYERERKTGLDYVDLAPLGAMDPAERLRRLDLENLERAFLYPTLGVLWIAECEDEELTQAYLRAYNRWIVDFCADSGGRLIPIAQLSLGDPAAAERELRRAASDGVRGVWVPPFTMTRKPLGHPNHHRVFAAAQELGLPLGDPSVLRAQVVRAGPLRGDARARATRSSST